MQPCDNGLICDYCHSFISESQIRDIHRQQNESYNYKLQLIGGLKEQMKKAGESFRISYFEDAKHLGSSNDGKYRNSPFSINDDNYLDGEPDFYKDFSFPDTDNPEESRIVVQIESISNPINDENYDFDEDDPDLEDLDQD